jgi:hypothetical protein
VHPRPVNVVVVVLIVDGDGDLAVGGMPYQDITDADETSLVSSKGFLAAPAFKATSPWPSPTTPTITSTFG